MSAGALVPIELASLGGGLNEGLPAAAIEDSEFAALENFYPFGTKLIRRGGLRRLTASPHGMLTSLFAFKQTIGVWVLIAGARDGIYRLDGSALTALAYTDGPLPPTFTNPIQFRQHKGEMLAVSKGEGRLLRVTSNLYHAAGIPAPASAVTLADGAAGAVEAGDYYYVVTFYNTGNGAESNPSPASAKLTHAAAKRVTVSTIPISTNAQVNARRIYRTLLNQRGEYYFVGQINDNSTTTFDDNVVQDDLGQSVSIAGNGLPPTGLVALELFAERLFVSDGKDVFFSAEGLPQGFDALDEIPVYEDDGHEIRVLHAHGAQLIVGKTNGIHFITGVGRRSFALETLSNKHGVVAPLSMQSAEGAILWLAEDNVYRSDGVNPPVSVSTQKIRRTLDAIPKEMREKAASAVFPSRSWYVLSIAESASTTNRKLLVYNYKTDAWTVFRYANGTGDAPGFLADFFDAYYGQVLYATMYDGHIYEWNSGNDDDGTPIAASLKTKAFSRSGFPLGVRLVSLLCAGLPESVRLRIFGDASSSASADRTVSLDRGSGWKDYNLSTLMRLATEVQLGLDYSGAQPLELEMLALSARGFNRRRKAA